MVGVVLLAGLVAPSCTFTLREPGVTVACVPLEFEINTHGVALSVAQRAAVVDTIDEFGARVKREVTNLGSTDATARGRTASDPVLIEVAWPSDAPSALGYAQPAVVGDEYVGGWIMLNPLVRHLTPGMLRRLVLHELGHLSGLADVSATDEIMNPALTTDTFGKGDLSGLFLTHHPCF